MSTHRQQKSGSKASRVRHRPPRKKPLNAPPPRYVTAKSEAVLQRLAPKIESLREEALAKRDTHAIFVLDSHCEWLRLGSESRAEDDPIAQFQRAMGHDSDAAVFPIHIIEGLFALFEEGGIAAGAVASLREPLPPHHARLVVMVGELVGVFLHDFGDCATELPRTLADIESVNDRRAHPGDPPVRIRRWVDAKPFDPADLDKGFMLSPAGMLKTFYATEPEMMETPEALERLRRFHEHGRRLWAREQLRPEPRDFGDVLLEAFGARRSPEP